MPSVKDVAILGKGMVGGAVLAWFKGAAWVSKGAGSFKKVDEKKYIFVCLPTPYSQPKRGFDLSIIVQTLKKLSGHKVIVIKSTVLPGATRSLAKLFPQHTFLFNPEFLRAKTAKQDFLKPERQIIGYLKEKDRKLASEILKILPKAPFSAICRAEEAEAAKIIGNCFLASKVVFANQIYDYCQKKKIDYDDTIKLVVEDSRIGRSHWKIFTDGYRGYSGACFLKDMGALVADSQLPLLKLAHRLNSKYLSKN